MLYRGKGKVHELEYSAAEQQVSSKSLTGQDSDSRSPAELEAGGSAGNISQLPESGGSGEAAVTQGAYQSRA